MKRVKNTISKTLAMLLAVLMIVGMLPTTAVAAGNESAADAEVFVTGAKGGTLYLVNQPVTVKDLNADGKLSYDEAMKAAHEAYCPNGYVSSEGSYGLQVGKLWGEGNGDFANALFYTNDVALQMNVGESYVKAGDRLYACSLKYSNSWNDAYTYFDETALTVDAGKDFILTLSGGSYMGGDLQYESLKVGTWSNGSFKELTGKTFANDGKITLSFDQPGTYIVSAEGEYDEGYGITPIMPPACVVTVETVPETVALDKSELSMIVGDEETLSATVTPEGTKVTWSSSDEAVATVENGKITALKAGTTTITATTAGGQAANCLVTVSDSIVTYLSALKFTAGTGATAAVYELQPAFSPEVKEYTLIVPDSKATVAVWATLAENQSGTIKAAYKNTSDANKTVTVTSGKATGTSLSSILRTNLNGNTLIITVGENEACTVTIVRKATLSGLTLSYGEDKTATLAPKFNGDTLEYSARVPHDTVITVTPKAKTTSAAVTINGANDTAITPVWSGLNSKVEIVVSGGTANPEVVPTTYKISLTQCAASLEILTPPTKTEYAAGDKFDPTGMTLKATYSDSSYEIVGADKFTYPKDALPPNTTEIEIGFDHLLVKQQITMPAVFDGTGTQADPYLIKTADDLVRLSELVEDGLSFSGEYFKMVNPITLPDTEGEDAWVPLGADKTKPFSGNFDGGNNLLTVPAGGLPLIGFPVGATLNNLNIYGSKIAGFGVVNNYAVGATITIDNVTLKSGTQTLKSGFIGGYASGQDAIVIKNSTVERNVVIGYDKQQEKIGSFGGDYNGTIENCVSYADVYGTDFVGGIAGCKGQSIGKFAVTNCKFYGTVIATGNYVGGIVGHGYGGTQWGISSAPNAPCITIQNCECSGNVTGGNYVGGILGAESGIAQCWENGIGYIENNRFTGVVKATSGTYVGGIIGYMRSLNKYNVITGNYYFMSCGASKGIGGAEYVDTNCATHETASGAIYLNTENSTSDCPKITYCSWKKAHNRADDPLGADAAKLCYTDTDRDPIAIELKASGTYKTEYTQSESLDLTGIILTVYYNWGDPKTIALDDVKITGFDTNQVGQQTVTIAYNGLTADISVTIKALDTETIEYAEKLIDDIGDVTIYSGSKIKAAREALEAMGKAEQACVKNVGTLTAAENTIATLYVEAAKADHKAIYESTGKYIVERGTPSVGGEWGIIGLERSGRDIPNAEGYYAEALKFVQKNITVEEKLDSSKSTENSRMILALTALGYDVTNVGGHNLLMGLTDMSYVKKQGINGPIWALIAFDCHNYDIPTNTKASEQVTRDKLIDTILAAQHDDGGWSLSANKAAASDPDITGMAIQSLAPYYNAKAKAAVDEALTCLSQMQYDNGGFGSVDGACSESCAQVIVALTALGINPETDNRFVKNGVSVVDAMCLFAVKDGGFAHVPNGGRNGMATEQSYYALTAYYRMLEKKTTLYDMTDVTIMSTVKTVETLIDAIGKVTVDSGDIIKAARAAYDSLSAADKKKVTNLDTLEDAEEAYDELTVVKNVIDLIDAIGTVTINSETRIAKARAAYNNLTAAQKKLVSNYYYLLYAEEELEEAKVEYVEDLISSIGTVTKESKTKIDRARTAYNNLSAANKKEVSNLSVLTAAEEAYKKLLKEDTDKNKETTTVTKDLTTIAGKVVEQIENIADDAAAGELLDAILAYETLTEAEKAATGKKQTVEFMKKQIAEMLQTDSKTGIGASGMEWNIQIVVSDPLDVMKVQEMQEKLGDNTVLGLWDIHLNDVLLSQEVQPDGTVLVKIPLTLLGDYSGFDGLAVVHYADDGTVEYLSSEIAEECVTFHATDFSYYAVVGYMGDSPLDDMMNDEANDTVVMPWIITGCCAVVLLGVVLFLNGKSKKQKVGKHAE